MHTHTHMRMSYAHTWPQEYTRAAHMLSGLDTPAALFLRCYALFLAGEKQKE